MAVNIGCETVYKSEAPIEVDTPHKLWEKEQPKANQFSSWNEIKKVSTIHKAWKKYIGVRFVLSLLVVRHCYCCCCYYEKV